MSSKRNRIITLDYLRGYFIIVIIIDHLNRWPNFFAFITGMDALWASAAEGFVIISGLMVGYIRGAKSREKPFAEVTKSVLKRSVTLYLWAILCTIILSVLTWYLAFKGGVAYVPIEPDDWATLLYKTFSLQYIHVLPYFLYIYAVLLFVSPVALWLLRRNKEWLVVILSFLAWGIGTSLKIESLQWAPFFFIPSVIGYHLDDVRRWLRRLTRTTKTILAAAVLVTSAITVYVSAANIFPQLGIFFGRDPLDLGRLIIGGLWFIALLIIFHICTPWLKRHLGWLLQPFGTRSLTAYILHAVPLMFIGWFFVKSDNIWLNTLMSVVLILTVWGLMKIPIVQRIIPR